MKTSFKFAALFVALTLPAVMTADALGVVLPSALSPTTVFGLLVATFALLTVVSDYARQPRFALRSSTSPRSSLATAASTRGECDHALAA